MIDRKSEVAVQTDDRQTIVNLENKLSEVDFNYKQKMVMGLRSVEESEARFLKFKAELNKRYKEELDQEVTRIRNFEIANIRMEEQEKGKLKMKDLE